MDHHVKSVNTDSRSRKNFRFASSKERSKKASADVYRSYKRRIGVTSAASREERVFHPHREESSKKRNKKQRRGSVSTEDAKDGVSKKNKAMFGDTVAETHDKQAKKASKATTKTTSTDLATAKKAEEDLDVTEATFSEELDLANDRNSSEIFREFYRDVWPLARSLPEVLHHASKIVDLILVYLLSNETEPHAISTADTMATSSTNTSSSVRYRFVLNHATTDLLHLLAVLAKDIRHEIHPYLHDKIIPRIVTDLLNQPTTAVVVATTSSAIVSVDNMDIDKDSNEEEDKEEDGEEEAASQVQPQQFMPIDVSVIEASFRTLSYIFRYDTDALLVETETSNKNSKRKAQDPCLEKLRQYYGATLAHRRDVVRRLAAETFAPLVRKLKSESARRRHLRRVVRALVTTIGAGNDNTNSKTARVMRLHSNAIDGISQLFFEVARGVAGQINSKGKVAAKVLFDVLCTDDTMTPAGRALVHSVTSSFLEKMCYHLHRRFVGEILKDVVATAQSVLLSVEGGSSAKGYAFGPQESINQLLLQLVMFREGTLLEHRTDETNYKSRGELTKIVARMMNVMVPLFPKLPPTVQMSVLNLLNATWKTIPDDAHFAKQVRKNIEGIVQCHPEASTSIQHPAHILARDLIPYLPLATGMGIVGTSILSAAANVVDKDSDLCLSLVLSVAKSSPADGSDTDNESEDALFSLERATQCRISAETKEALLGACLLDLKSSKSIAEISKFGVASLCISFLVLIEVNDDDSDDIEGKDMKGWFNKASRWLLQVFQLFSGGMEQGGSHKQDRSIVASLALESLARLSVDFRRRDICGASAIKKALCQAQSATEKLLLSSPTSHWTLRSTAAFVEALQLVDLVLEDKNAVFDSLIPNLRSASHFKRLYSLQILGSLPKKPFVTDHADLDLADDLDEEPNEYAAKNGSAKGAVVRSGLCDIMDTLTSIESISIDFHNERQLLSLISRVEVLGRTTKLPVVYTEAAANYMLGILYIKFSPIWTNAVRTFVSLASGQDAALVWSPLKGQLSKLMSKMPAEAQHPLEEESPDKFHKSDYFARHQSQCKTWDDSDGTNQSLFGRDLTQRLPTDEATVLQHLWSVIEGAPQLLARNSREIVPIFLQFMHSQFYARYPHDPDARELHIEAHVEDKTR